MFVCLFVWSLVCLCVLFLFFLCLFVSDVPKSNALCRGGQGKTLKPKNSYHRLVAASLAQVCGCCNPCLKNVHGVATTAFCISPGRYSLGPPTLTAPPPPRRLPHADSHPSPPLFIPGDKLGLLKITKIKNEKVNIHNYFELFSPWEKLQKNYGI